MLQLFLSLIVCFTVQAEEMETYLKELTSSYYNSYGLKNHYLKNINNNRRALAILPGMSEPAAKYWEVYKDLKDLQYDIYIWDHIGQGQSDYLDSQLDPQKVHIDQYESYIKPLTAYLKGLKSRYETVDILSHSMGAHIASHILIQNPYLIHRIILNAPMFSMKLHGAPHWLVSTALSLFYANKSWAPFQGKYRYRPLAESKVSQSQKRIEQYHQLMLQQKKLQRGGITAGWILASIDSNKKIRDIQKWKNIEVPALILLAGKDDFVDNKPTQGICEQMKNCSTVLFEQSKHEILMEKDSIRRKALQEIRAFLLRNEF